MTRNSAFRREEAWVQPDEDRKKNRYHFDRHTPDYRHHFEAIIAEMQAKCPVAWSDTYDGRWTRRPSPTSRPGFPRDSKPTQNSLPSGSHMTTK